MMNYEINGSFEINASFIESNSEFDAQIIKRISQVYQVVSHEFAQSKCLQSPLPIAVCLLPSIPSLHL